MSDFSLQWEFCNLLFTFFILRPQMNLLSLHMGVCLYYLRLWLPHMHEFWKEMSLDFALIFWYVNHAVISLHYICWHGVTLWDIRMKWWPKCSWKRSKLKTVYFCSDLMPTTQFFNIFSSQRGKVVLIVC